MALLKRTAYIEIELDVEAEEILNYARANGLKLDQHGLANALTLILEDRESGVIGTANVTDYDHKWHELADFDELVDEALSLIEGLCDYCKAGECHNNCIEPDCSCEYCPHSQFSCRYCGEECENSIDLDKHQMDCEHNPENFVDDDDDDGNNAA